MPCVFVRKSGFLIRFLRVARLCATFDFLIFLLRIAFLCCVLFFSLQVLLDFNLAAVAVALGKELNDLLLTLLESHLYLIQLVGIAVQHSTLAKVVAHHVIVASTSRDLLVVPFFEATVNLAALNIRHRFCIRQPIARSLTLFVSTLKSQFADVRERC